MSEINRSYNIARKLRQTNLSPGANPPNFSDLRFNLSECVKELFNKFNVFQRYFTFYSKKELFNSFSFVHSYCY